ncbi:hypothetical protein JKY79_02620, partial [Candidatus Babeliales bacterium]|nr:hypothetical protein [Candidatus Babeliales bacterium]
MKNNTYGFQSRGIVIKRFFPYKKMIHIFDEEDGVIALHFFDNTLLHRLWPGMYITYNYSEKGITKYLSSMDILLVPTSSCYQILQQLQRLIKICNYCIQKNIPNKKHYSLLFVGVHSLMQNISFFKDIELWLSALILQDSGHWNKDLYLVINSFLMKLSMLIDSFIEQEVELFRKWLTIVNEEHGKSLEVWIEMCLNEQVYYEE